MGVRSSWGLGAGGGEQQVGVRSMYPGLALLVAKTGQWMRYMTRYDSCSRGRWEAGGG